MSTSFLGKEKNDTGISNTQSHDLFVDTVHCITHMGIDLRFYLLGTLVKKLRRPFPTHGSML